LVGHVADRDKPSRIELSGRLGSLAEGSHVPAVAVHARRPAVRVPPILEGPLDEVFSDENILDPANNFVFARTGTNNQSYIAATMTDHVFGDRRLDLSTTLGALAPARAGKTTGRPRSAGILTAIRPSNPQVTTNPTVLARGTFASDEIYPAARLTYMGNWWAETFQLRFGWSRPRSDRICARSPTRATSIPSRTIWSRATPASCRRT
jgi:hypothetical protein